MRALIIKTFPLSGKDFGKIEKKMFALMCFVMKIT